VSVAEHEAAPGAVAGVVLESCLADIVEVSAPRGCALDLARVADSWGARLASHGHATASPECITICVRPERWLLLATLAPPGATAQLWHRRCAPAGVVIDLSSAWSVLRLTGAATREVLARGCRLDLDPGVFRDGHAASTTIAQVTVIVAALGAGFLLLTPATTSRDFCEWLTIAARTFGLSRRANCTLRTGTV